MQIQSTIFTDKQEWLECRKRFVSSTESAALFNEGAWLTYYQLWHLKNGTLEDDFKETEKTKAGLRYEEVIALHFAENYKSEIEKIEEYRYCNETKLGSSYDYKALNVELEGYETGDYLLECKNLDSFSIARWEDGEPPYQYIIQCHHQLTLYPEAKGAILCCLVNGWNLQIFVIERNESMEAAIKIRTEHFWNEIEFGEEPEPSYPGDSENVAGVHSFVNGNTEEASDEACQLAIAYDNASQAMKSLEAVKKEMRARLFALSSASKLKKDNISISMSEVNGSPGKLITADMVGQRIGARSGGRQLRVTVK